MAIEYEREEISSGYNLSKINSNFQKIETSLQDGLSRSGDGPNQMNADLDMNSNDILNAKSIETESLFLNNIQVGTEDVPLVILEEVIEARDETLAALDQVEDLLENVTINVTPVALVFDGVQTVFPLGVNPVTKANVFIEVNGATQTTDAYSIVGSDLVFTSAPPVGTGEARIIAAPLLLQGLGPGTFVNYPNPFLLSSSSSNTAVALYNNQTLSGSAGGIGPTQAIEYTYNGDAAIGLDFPGAPGGSVVGGLYSQHRQIGSNSANNAFTHSIMAYALNDAAGDNDVIGVSGRVRKNDVVDGVGDAAGVWGSAYQYSTRAGLVMAAEATAYQNVAGNIADDRLNSGSHAASVALHLGSYSTGSPTTAIIAADGSGFGTWNYEIVDKNLFAGAGIAGTVAYNCASWDANNFPEIGWKVGNSTWHIHRGDAAVNINANQINLQNTQTNGSAGKRIKASGVGNAYIDFMTGTTFRGQIFWDGGSNSFILGSVGLFDLLFRTNEQERFRITANGNVVSTSIQAKNYANDAAASAAGVPIGGFYHNAGDVRIRLV